MTTHRSVPSAAGNGSLHRCLAFLATMVAIVCTTNVNAQAPAVAGGVVSAPSAAELDGLVSRIALYPDDLVAIILPAATNPLQVVQADSYLAKRTIDPGLKVNEKWDDAIKSLLNYPEIIKTMSADIDWTAALGEAVVADQGEVLAAIQTFRRKTQAAGNLNSDAKQVVVVEKEVINIVPADPQVIYVPQYNPSTIVVSGGPPSWGYYSSPYPVYYYPYPPGAALATGLIWGAAIGAAWNGGRYVTHYGGNANININRNVNIGNINTGNVNFNRPGAPRQTPAGGATQWKPNRQSGQVSSAVGRTSATRAGYSGAAGGAGSAAGRAPIERAGTFGGNASGRQTQMDSSRGAQSRGSMGGAGAGAGARTTPPAAGAHRMPSGGGRGGDGGGGGGGRRGDRR